MGKRVVDRLACAELRPEVECKGRFDLDTAAVLDRLSRFSPEVESAGEDGSAFWLNAAGLERLYASPRTWADAIFASLKKMALSAAIAVGFTRFGTHALARSGQGIVVFESLAAERAALHRVPLSRLGLSTSLQRGLVRLGKRTVGDLIGLKAGDLLERFGPEAARVCSLAKGDVWDPLRPAAFEEPVTERLEFEQPVANTMRLTFFAKRLLGALIAAVARRSQALAVLEIDLALDHGDRFVERIKPAAPTLDEVQLIDLVRLRLESLSLPVGAVEMVLTAFAVPRTTEQLVLFPERPLRDGAAAQMAFARLRAEFGGDAVVWANIREGHLPEAQFAFESAPQWSGTFSARVPCQLHECRERQTGRPFVSRKEEVESLSYSEEKGPEKRTLVRRIFTRPVPLQVRPVRGPRGCHLLGMGEAPFARISGPYVVSGGWWAREVCREYHFAETERGKVVWVYFDKRRRQWFLHGEVS